MDLRFFSIHARGAAGITLRPLLVKARILVATLYVGILIFTCMAVSFAVAYAAA